MIGSVKECQPLPVLQHRVRIVSRALGRHDLVTAWGHCSARIDDHRFLVCAAKPMGLIAPGDDGVVVDINGPLPDGVLGEVRIHQKIYAMRPDAGGICRIMPSNTMALSTLGRVPRPRHGWVHLSRAVSSGMIRGYCGMMTWPNNWQRGSPMKWLWSCEVTEPLQSEAALSRPCAWPGALRIPQKLNVMSVSLMMRPRNHSLPSTRFQPVRFLQEGCLNGFGSI